MLSTSRATGTRRPCRSGSSAISRAWGSLAALRLRADDREYVAGHTSPVASVGASRWELFRGLGSRRSASQLRALRWSGDPEPYVPLIPAYGARVDDLIE